MKTKPVNPIVISVSIIAGMAFIFTVLLFTANSLQDAFTRTILVSLGSAIFGAGLTFFLLNLTRKDK